MESEPNVQEVTAEDILRSLITTVKDDWNGRGVRLWAERQLEDLPMKGQMEL